MRVGEPNLHGLPLSRRGRRPTRVETIVTFEPLHIIEVFVPTRCLLVPKQRSPADDGYAPRTSVKPVLSGEINPRSSR